MITPNLMGYTIKYIWKLGIYFWNRLLKNALFQCRNFVMSLIYLSLDLFLFYWIIEIIFDYFDFSLNFWIFSRICGQCVFGRRRRRLLRPHVRPLPLPRHRRERTLAQTRVPRLRRAGRPQEIWAAVRSHRQSCHRQQPPHDSVDAALRYLVKTGQKPFLTALQCPYYYNFSLWYLLYSGYLLRR